MSKPLKRQIFVKQSSVAGDMESGENGAGGPGNNGEGEDDLLPTDEGLGSGTVSDGASSSDSGSSSTEDGEKDEKVDMGDRPASPRPQVSLSGFLKG